MDFVNFLENLSVGASTKTNVNLINFLDSDYLEFSKTSFRPLVHGISKHHLAGGVRIGLGCQTL